jgi:DNA-binding GntR family transcriptional regulator
MEKEPSAKSKPAAAEHPANLPRTGDRSLAERAYQRLRLAIIECRFGPGERLTEAAIAHHLRVGKTPAREALRRLVLEGLARVTPRHGYTVAPITLRDVQELFDLRLLLEPAAAELAAGTQDASSLSRLRRLSRLGYDTGGRNSIREFVRANTELHVQIARLCGNRRFAELIAQMLAESERLINFGVLLRPQSERTVAEHRRLIEALENGDAASARRVAEEHIRATRQMVVESLISDASLREVSITRTMRKARVPSTRG